MKTFLEYAEQRGVNLSEMFPNMGQRAIPINGGGAKAPQPGPTPATPPPPGGPGAGATPAGPKQVSLSSLADRVQDPDWHQLYEKFSEWHKKHQGNPKVQELGMALYRAAQSGDMSGIKPFVQQFLKAQPRV